MMNRTVAKATAAVVALAVCAGGWFGGNAAAAEVPGGDEAAAGTGAATTVETAPGTAEETTPGTTAEPEPKAATVPGTTADAGATAQAAPAMPVSAAATRVWFYVGRTEAFVNGVSTTLLSPANSYNGKMYVPVKFLGETFGFPVVYDSATNSISLTAGSTDVWIDLTNRSTLVGGLPDLFQPTFVISPEGKLMAQLTWIMDRIGATYSYDSLLGRVEVIYAPWTPELPTALNSKPIAKFTFGKDTYKIGEKVNYINLSYDAEGDGIAYVYWTNAQEAFFTSGRHEVSLQVEDSKGNRSAPVSRTITIENETMFTPVQFQMHHARLQSFVKLTAAEIASHFRNVRTLPLSKTTSYARTLLVSNSPETIAEYGVLYRDTVSGKARLYANHVNAMDKDVQFAILLTNNGREPVTVDTTTQGEVYPSTFVHLIGYQASVDFLDGDANKPRLTIQPGQTAAYAYLPRMTKGQGINLIYDVDTSGETVVTFAAMSPGTPLTQRFEGKELEYNGHVRGTFPVSEITLTAAASTLPGTARFTIGGNESDEYVSGYDAFRRQPVVNYGNYGVIYRIRVNQPGKTAVAMLARGGAFKGPLKINGEMVLAPVSGVITALDGVFMLYRTGGNEPFLDIEITPPAGSHLPIDIVLYPLES